MSPSPDTSSQAYRRILVVDDEPTLRLAFCYTLMDAHTDVEAVGDGRSALERLESGQFDLLILDLRMPNLDGAAVLDELRDSGNQIPVILCTAMLNSGIVSRAGRHGVVDFLLKPVLPDPLRYAVDFVLHPEHWPHSDAWEAARRGNLTVAASLLRDAAALLPREAAWLRHWESLQKTPASGESETENMNLIALNRLMGH